jgi:hypothetical protein
MAVIVNKNTTQTPLTSGSTGTQVIKFVDAPRVYIKTADVTATPVTTKSNGSTPSGWTDLGGVNGKVRIAYEKEIREVRTGIDQVLRQSYVGQKSGSFEFVLDQFDDVVIEELSGINPYEVQAGSAYSFSLGSEDIVSKALLLVVQNKLDGKEWQFYSPNADLSFTLEDSGDQTVVRGRANLKAFSWNSVEPLMVATDFA